MEVMGRTLVSESSEAGLMEEGEGGREWVAMGVCGLWLGWKAGEEEEDGRGGNVLIGGWQRVGRSHVMA